MSQSNKRVLITGVSGFVGSLMAKRLLKQGLEVYGFMRQRADGLIPHNLAKLDKEDKLNLIEGNLENLSSINKALVSSEADIIFHFGGQSFIPRSFEEPLETVSANCLGTANLLEAIRITDLDPVVVFAGSSEEYGLVISSQTQYEEAKARYGTVFPEPQKIPEVPIAETNPLRPMSPYAISKLYGDYLARNYWNSYGIKVVISRAFNHEGAGRGTMFVTSAIARQVINLKVSKSLCLTIGNANAFRDWSHVDDIIEGYQLLAEKGKFGDVYNQGSMRTNSVMSYLLLCLNEAGYPIDKIETFSGNKIIDRPLEPDDSEIYGIRFEKTRIDDMMLREELTFASADKGVIAYSDSNKVRISFDRKMFRPAEVPIMLSNTDKFKAIGFRSKHTIIDIIKDQLDYWKPEQDSVGN